jgi:outer membrane receptor protein involved in Fe transport
MEPDNIGSAKSFGLELSAGFKPLPFWFAMISTNAWYSKLEELDENTEPDLHGNSFGYFTFLMNKIFLPVVGQVELTARQFNLHTTSGKNTPKIMASLAVKRSFFSERLDMTFKIKNLFDDAGFELEEVISLDSHDQTRHLWHSREGRTFYLTLKYNFGELKEKKRRQKKWDRDGSEGGGMGMDF